MDDTLIGSRSRVDEPQHASVRFPANNDATARYRVAADGLIFWIKFYDL
jgi:hypothetical protein